MKRRFPAFTLSLVLLAALAGCASDGVEVSTTYDPLARFPARATYSWDFRANKLPEDPRIAELDLGPQIEEAADAVFAAHGYRRVDSGSADYRLSCELVVHTWLGADNSRSVGTLSMLLVDAKTGRRVWLGFGRAEIRVGLRPEERQERLRAALARMLEDFPPNQGD